MPTDFLDIPLSTISCDRPSTLVASVGFERGESKRSDGLFPFANNKSIIWDVTCIDIFVSSSIMESTTNTGHVGVLVNDAKRSKYAGVLNRFIFQLNAIAANEIIGPTTRARNCFNGFSLD